MFIWATLWENLSCICEQLRHRSACASVQSDQCLFYSLPRYYNTSSSYIRNFKTLASLISWAGRFESYLVKNPKDRFSHDEDHLCCKIFSKTKKKKLNPDWKLDHWLSQQTILEYWNLEYWNLEVNSKLWNIVFFQTTIPDRYKSGSTQQTAHVSHSSLPINSLDIRLLHLFPQII